MKRLIVGGLAALAIGLGTAPMVSASPTTDFFDDITWSGYLGRAAWRDGQPDLNLLQSTGLAVCDKLAEGMSPTAINYFIVDALDDPRPDAAMHANAFAGWAAVHFCPHYADENW